MQVNWQVIIVLVVTLELAGSVFGDGYFEPFNVTYDHRSLIIGGRRRILISAGIHYPRSTPEMWPDVIAKAKQGGADVIETYTFWNAHEPLRRQYNFQGRYDLVKFIKLVGSNRLFLFLRIGPYVCAEWNFGGFPVWLRDIPGIEFRTDNAPFKVIALRRDSVSFSNDRISSSHSLGGGDATVCDKDCKPNARRKAVLLARRANNTVADVHFDQIENEYGDFEKSYGKKGQNYIKWAAKMAVDLKAGVPWVMCKQTDAPEFIIDTCNGYYCDGFKPNSKKKPIFWTENWDGWYTKWGGRLPHRPVEDLAFAVARFFQRGGSLQNYYMYFGGTNFGRTSGGPFYITSYDYDAPIDEYGLLSQPKWGHLKDLHAAIKLCEAALVAVDSPEYVKLGPQQEAHVYQQRGIGGNYSRCSAFLANINEHNVASVKFRGRVYSLPPWSVSILPDCKNVAYNTAKVGAQTSIKDIQSVPHQPSKALEHVLLRRNGPSLISKNWMRVDETVGVWTNGSFAVRGILEHLNVTKDSSDYLWHFTRIYISVDDISFWKRSGVSPALTIDSMRDVVHIYVNGQLAGSRVGSWVQVFQPLQLLEGYNDVVLLSLTVGLQNYGAFLEKDGGGFRGQIKLTGLSNGDMNLSESSWTYQVGLSGEVQQIYTSDGTEKAAWLDLMTDAVEHPLSWYKVLVACQILAKRWLSTYFDAPDGMEPVALDLKSMGKGQAWVNGHHIGRYWTLSAPEDGCQSTCDYRGKYDSAKCTTNCGKPTQVRYHVPRSWLKKSNNLLVVFEEIGGNPFEISVTSHSTHTICAEVSESHYPPLSKWLTTTSASIDGKIYINDTTPEMHLQCEPGYVISTAFASYGTPQGSCQRFSTGSCHSPNSFNMVSELCEGKQECTIGVSNAVFGGDPCRHTVKTLAVEAKCLSSKGISSKVPESSFVDVL